MAEAGDDPRPRGPASDAPVRRDPAVDDVSFALAPGELLALIGPNGAGKSTCFNMLMGQLAPSSGQVLLSGRDITGWPPRRIWRTGVGRTFQITATYASMTVIENVQMALLSHHRRTFSLLPRAHRLYRDEAMALLETVGMGATGRAALRRSSPMAI